MLKVKMTFVIEEEDLKDIFDSYDVKFTKAKLTQLKKAIKECEEENEDFFREDLQSDFENLIGNFIDEVFNK